MRRTALTDIKALTARAKAFLEGTGPGACAVLLTPDEGDEIVGPYLSGELLMTHLGDAVLVHYAPEGDWTRALLIPSENFVDTGPYVYSPADEAIEWFLR